MLFVEEKEEKKRHACAPGIIHGGLAGVELG